LKDKMISPLASSDPSRFLFLYGTTPPRADASEERVQRASSRLTERLEGLSLDGLVVYDVQDESDRMGEPRPFPFLPTLDSRTYARLLHETTGLPVICYKSVARMPESAWEAWLDATGEGYDLRHLSLVGRASSRQESGGIHLPEALRIAAAHKCGFTLGGVVIPERHRPEKSESARLLHKTENGCSYFISQAVYSPEATIRLLHDYDRDCREQNVTPRRIYLTFTPCGSVKTLEFMQWLGISFPENTLQTLLSSETPLADSLRICTENLSLILEATAELNLPLGVNVESVSIRKEEIMASVDLLHGLREIAGKYLTGKTTKHVILNVRTSFSECSEESACHL
jgi:5,10-methylenetetrahydrofolate reductase